MQFAHRELQITHFQAHSRIQFLTFPTARITGSPNLYSPLSSLQSLLILHPSSFILDLTPRPTLPLSPIPSPADIHAPCEFVRIRH